MNVRSFQKVFVGMGLWALSPLSVQAMTLGETLGIDSSPEGLSSTLNLLNVFTCDCFNYDLVHANYDYLFDVKKWVGNAKYAT